MWKTGSKRITKELHTLATRYMLPQNKKFNPSVLGFYGKEGLLAEYKAVQETNARKLQLIHAKKALNLERGSKAPVTFEFSKDKAFLVDSSDLFPNDPENEGYLIFENRCLYTMRKVVYEIYAAKGLKIAKSKKTDDFFTELIKIPVDKKELLKVKGNYLAFESEGAFKKFNFMHGREVLSAKIYTKQWGKFDAHLLNMK